MPSATFGPVPDAQPEMAAKFFKDWFDGEDTQFATVTRILPGQRGNLKHLHFPPTVFREMFEGASLDELIYADNERWNLYMGVGLMEKPPEKTNRKGGKKDVSYVPGVWVDLDVDKDGCFRDEEHALSLLRSVHPYPTIVVATGTGGVHGYWKTERPLGPQEAENLTEMWWAHLQREAQVKIDKLTNCDRIMKLPGSIRWEKNPGDNPSLVRLLYSSPDTVRAGELQRVALPAWNDYRNRIAQKRRAVEHGRVEATAMTGNLTGWNRIMAIAGYEDEFNETHTWHQLLEPLGWVDLGPDGEGRTQWARPGYTPEQRRKSAATDYQDSQAMSLFTDSSATGGLWELHEAGIPLTKYRVYIQCYWNGDEKAFVAKRLEGLA